MLLPENRTARYTRLCVRIFVLLVSNQFRNMYQSRYLCMRSAPVELSNFWMHYFLWGCFFFIHIHCSIGNLRTVNNTAVFFCQCLCVSVCVHIVRNIYSATASNVNKDLFVDKINTNKKRAKPLWYLFRRFYDNWKQVLKRKK